MFNGALLDERKVLTTRDIDYSLNNDRWKQIKTSDPLKDRHPNIQRHHK